MGAYTETMTIDAALRDRMKSQKLTQLQAAAKIGVPQPQLSKWLRLVDVPSDNYATALAKFLDVKTDEARLLISRAREAKASADTLSRRIDRLEAQVAEILARLEAE